MTKRIENKFEALKKTGEKALVGFVSAGDPNQEKSLEIILAMCEAGVDILELGIPFSDPTADGPVIQRSSHRALQSGIRMKQVLEMTTAIRSAHPDIPIILFSYYNPIHAYGQKQFYEDAVKSGADGTLVVDLPPEESDELTEYFGDDFAFIRLIAPTTPKERIQMIADNATGFIYLVSKTGVTGSDGLDTGSIESFYESVTKASDVPVCVGFGISTPDDVREIASFADGIVIGSAFERLIEDNLDNDAVAGIVGERVRQYKAAAK